MGSNAVSLERKSRIVGYKITKGDFREVSPNLPQRIAILAEANAENQATLDTDPWLATSSQVAGNRYGFGSPIYHIMRILRPVNSEGVGGIPIVVYPQAEASGALTKKIEVAFTGTVNGNGTHRVLVAGRYGIDGRSYDVNIEVGDTAAAIYQKYADAINSVLGCPFKATAAATKVTLESKWKGLTAEGLNVIIDTNGDDLSLTYVVTSAQTASGTPSIGDALDSFGTEWNTIVINSYGTVESIMNALEDFNGVPDPENPTGRYAGIIMKPFIALTGSVADDPSSITDDREEEVTIAICPAPLSKGLPMEAAANMAVLFARQAQNTPHLDVSGRSYPDMPTPTDIGSMQSYDNRDIIMKKGCSTVELISERYVVQDFVTTYHPVGEAVPQFSYCRNLNIDFNIRFGYYELEKINVRDHAIAKNYDTVSVQNVIKPKQWKQILDNYASDLAMRALIVDPEFMKSSIDVDLSTSNPDRLETFFRYKRSGFVRIASTTVEAGFNFGNLN